MVFFASSALLCNHNANAKKTGMNDNIALIVVIMKA